MLLIPIIPWGWLVVGIALLIVLAAVFAFFVAERLLAPAVGPLL